MIRELPTDRRTHFRGSVMQHVVQLSGIRHLMTSPYHLQCDGQAERAIQTFSRIISHFLHDNQKNWDLLVPYAAWCMNTMVQETTGFTAFELVHGRRPVNQLDLVLNFQGWEYVQNPTEYAVLVHNWLKGAREVALEKVNRSFDDQAPQFNDKRREVTLAPGQLILEWKPVGQS